MSKIALDFYGYTFPIEKPRSLSSLRKNISELFPISSNDIEDIILKYKNNEGFQEIRSNEDIKSFLNSKILIISLFINEESKFYLDYKNKLKKQNLGNLFDEQMEKKLRWKKLKETKLNEARRNIQIIELKINKLKKKKEEIKKRISEILKIIEEEENEIDKNIKELEEKIFQLANGPQIKTQKPINIKVIKSPDKLYEQQKISKKKINKDIKPLINLGEKKYIEIKSEKEINETNEKKDSTKRVIDETENGYFNNIQDISKKISEKSSRIQGLSRSLNDQQNIEEDNREKKEKEIHHFIKCNECETNPIKGKRFKCKICNNLNLCEKCYEKKKESHGHEFEIIEISTFQRSLSKKRPKYKQINKHNNIYARRKTNGIPSKFIIKKMVHCPTTENILKIDKNINPYINCSQCGKNIISGCRFKCGVCIDFYYCVECETKYSNEHNHPFLKIYN